GNGTEPGTTWSNFDAMGRPQTMTLPDGHVVSWSYTGDRVSVRTSTIASGTIPGSGPAPENAFTHEENYDRFGRLVRVVEPSGPGNTMVNTDLAYDVGGRMKQVTHGSQVRAYTYDRRGFLKSETIPEFGASGNGTRYFCSFDAAGNAWKTRETP